MSDEAALLRAIHAEPDEDTPRLVYADWLDEHGQPERAEFIRVQIECANQEDRTSDEYDQLRLREYVLEEEHKQHWTAHLFPFNESTIDFRFYRGFPEQIWARGAGPEDFAILRRLPGLRYLEITDATISPDVLRDIVNLRQLDGLSISSTLLEPSWLEMLDQLPCWTYFYTDMYYRDEEWEAAAGWDQFQERRISQVTTLPPREQRSAAIRFLGERPNQPVKQLNLYKQRISDSELRFLSYLPELEEIVIHQGQETVEGLRHLSGLPNLKKFIISDTECESLVPITNCTTLEHLEYHTLGAPFGDDGVVGLERLVNLRHLELCPQWGDGHRDTTLQRIGALRELRTLRIVLERLEDERSLASLMHLPKLESLMLEGAYYQEYTGDEIRRFLASLPRQ